MSAPGPLAGRRVLVTRPRDQGGELRRRLAALGATVVDAPAIAIVPLDDSPEVPIAATLRRAAAFDWLVVTSPNGGRLLIDRLAALAAPLGGVRVAAVGPGTARILREGGVAVELSPPDRHRAEGLLAALRGRVRPGERVLIVRAAEGSPVLPEGLRALGAEVEVLPLYRTVPAALDAERLRAALREGEIDAVVFASGFAVRAVVDAVGAQPFAAPRRPRVVCLGPVTATAAAAAGVPADRVAAQATAEALASAVVAALAGAEARS